MKRNKNFGKKTLRTLFANQLFPYRYFIRSVWCRRKFYTEFPMGENPFLQFSEFWTSKLDYSEPKIAIGSRNNTWIIVRPKSTTKKVLQLIQHTPIIVYIHKTMLKSLARYSPKATASLICYFWLLLFVCRLNRRKYRRQWDRSATTKCIRRDNLNPNYFMWFIVSICTGPPFSPCPNANLIAFARARASACIAIRKHCKHIRWCLRCLLDDSID